MKPAKSGDRCRNYTKRRDKKGLGRMMDDNRSFLPMMMFFGIMDIMMFSMMFSMMGAAMTDYVPAERHPGRVRGRR